MNEKALLMNGTMYAVGVMPVKAKIIWPRITSGLGTVTHATGQPIGHQRQQVTLLPQLLAAGTLIRVR